MCKGFTGAKGCVSLGAEHLMGGAKLLGEYVLMLNWCPGMYLTEYMQDLNSSINAYSHCWWKKSC